MRGPPQQLRSVTATAHLQSLCDLGHRQCRLRSQLLRQPHFDRMAFAVSRQIRCRPARRLKAGGNQSLRPGGFTFVSFLPVMFRLFSLHHLPQQFFPKDLPAQAPAAPDGAIIRSCLRRPPHSCEPPSFARAADRHRNPDECGAHVGTDGPALPPRFTGGATARRGGRPHGAQRAPTTGFERWRGRSPISRAPTSPPITLRRRCNSG